MLTLWLAARRYVSKAAVLVSMVAAGNTDVSVQDVVMTVTDQGMRL